MDFSNNHNFHTSLSRIKSLDGIEPIDAQALLDSGKFPEIIYRFDNNFTKLKNARGLPKASLITEVNGRRSLRPVNPNGDGSIVNHIAADNAINRASSPYISFSGDIETVERFGSKSISINVRALLQGIANGKVRGVDVITINQLRQGAQKKLTSSLQKIGISQGTISSTLKRVHKVAKSSDGHLTHEQSEEIQRLINEVIEESRGLNRQAKEELTKVLKLDIDYLRHSITNNEVLIRGTVPEDFLAIPKNL